MTGGAARGACLAAVVAAAVLAPGAVAQPSDPAPPAMVRAPFLPDGASPRGLAAYAGPDGLVDSTAVYRQLVAAAVHAGADPKLLRTALGHEEPAAADDDGETYVIVSSDGVVGLSSMLSTVGDVDGNGTGDMADMRFALRKDKGYDTALYLRDGATGRVLWQRRWVLPRGHFAFPASVRVGSPARAGVLLYEFGFQDSEDRTVTTETMTALRGRDGRQLWRHRSTGEMRRTESGYSGTSTYVAGVLPGAARQPDELLMVGQEFTVNRDAGTRAGAVTGTALSLATGRQRPLLARTSSSDSLPSLQLLPDLSGDGRDDLGLLVGGSGSRIEARRGTNGAAIWTARPEQLADGASLWPAGRVTGGKAAGRVVDDVAVVVPPVTVATVSTPFADVPLGAQHGEVVLLGGSSGAQVWSRTGDLPVAVARAGTPLRPSLAVATVDTSKGVSETTVTLSLVSYSATGETVYEKSYSLTAPSSDEFSFGFGTAYAFGDLQADGAQDVTVLLLLITSEGAYDRRFVVDGATGGEVAGADSPLGPSVTGRGMDLYSLKAGSTLQLTVRRGRDRGVAFTRTLRPGSPMQDAYAWSERLQTRCADVVVQGYGKTHEYVAVLGPTGAPRWSLLHKRNALAAGTVARHTSPRMRCA